MKNKFVIFLVVVFISACSSSDDSQGVISTNDLSTQTTVTTIVEDVVEETLSPEDAELLLARCLRDNGYDVQDPKNNEGLRSVLTPIFIAADERGRTELFQTIQTCAEENNIPLGNNADFENPEDVADRLDTELEFAQCLRGKGIEVEDPSQQEPKLDLSGLKKSEDDITPLLQECGWQK